MEATIIQGACPSKIRYKTIQLPDRQSKYIFNIKWKKVIYIQTKRIKKLQKDKFSTYQNDKKRQKEIRRTLIRPACRGPASAYPGPGPCSGPPELAVLVAAVDVVDVDVVVVVAACQAGPGAVLMYISALCFGPCVL